MKRQEGSKFDIGNDAIAGTISGALTRMIIAPFDVLKIRFQNQVIVGTRYEGLFHATKTISREEGIRGFWKGSIPGIFLWGTYSMVQFPVYFKLKALLSERHQNEEYPILDPLFCGGLAACVAQTISFPFDTIRTRVATLPVSDPHYQTSLLSYSTGILKRETAKGFFSGWRVTMLQVAPNNALVFLLYENLSLEFAKNIPILSFASKGAIAGVVAKLITYPLDTIKKRLQLNGSVAVVPKYDSIKSCMNQIVHQEGYTAFYKGLSPQLLKTAVSYSISFTIFEVCSSFLHSRYLPPN